MPGFSFARAPTRINTTLSIVMKKLLPLIVLLQVFCIGLFLPSDAHAQDVGSQSWELAACKKSAQDFVSAEPGVNTTSGCTYTSYCPASKYSNAHSGNAYEITYYRQGTWYTYLCYAFNGTYEQPKGLGAQNCGAGTPQITCGNPINTGNGNKFQTETDYSGTRLLSFIRYYNSAPEAPTDLLGIQWSNNYTRRVQYKALMPSVATVLRPDGRNFVYQLNSGAWQADADVVGKLVQLTDQSGAFTGWQYQEQDGREVEDYDGLGRLIGITRSDGQSVVLVYNNGVIQNKQNDYLPSSITAQDGRHLTLSYDSSGRLAQLIDPAGGTYIYAYDALSRLTSVTYPDGKSKNYKYGELQYTNQTDLPTALTSIVDEKGNTFAIFNYQADGRAISTEHAGGVEKYAMVYNADGTTSMTTPTGALQLRAFVMPNGVQKISSISTTANGATKVSTYSYDAAGRADLVTDAAGVKTDYDYDSRGLLTQRVDSANYPETKRSIRTTFGNASFSVPTARNLLDSTGALKAQTTWTYNTRGQVASQSIVDPVSHVGHPTQFAYCETISSTCPFIGLLSKVLGPLPTADDTSYAYYSDNVSGFCAHRTGDLQTVTNALGQATSYLCYDGAGRPLSVKDAKGVTREFIYSPRGWLTQAIVRGIDPNSTADDAITTIAYDPTGTVSKVTQPDGDYLMYNYDSAHRLIKVIDKLANSINYTLDAAGNSTAENTNEAGPNYTLRHKISQVFDQLGRLQKTLNAASQATLITYDANDNVDLVSDPLNHTANQDVDALNRPTQTTQDVGGLNVLTKLQYDARDDLVQVTDPKNLNTVYTYDGFNNLTNVSSPDTGSTAYTYDSAGNRLSQTDARGVTTTYGYDLLNRLTSVSYPHTGLNVTYTYDQVNAACLSGEAYAIGHLTQMQDSTGFTRFCYDRFGNLTRKVQIYGTFTQTTLFEYTLGGRLLSVTYPSGAKATYGRNADGQINNVQLTVAGVTSTLLSNVGYYPFGPISQLTFGNGRVQTRTYNQDYAPTAITDPTPTSVSDPSIRGLNLTITPDAVGNITQLVSTLDGAGTTRNYSYDGLGRLTLATTPGTPSLDETFTYDGTGDRQSKRIGTGALQSYVYASNSHQPSTVAGAARSYDQAGNTLTLTTGGTVKTLTYDDRGEMTESKITNAVFYDYLYNGRGERVGRTSPSNSVQSFHFVYDEAGHMLGEYGNGGNVLREYIWLGDTLVGVIAASDNSTSKFEYVETDQVGTPRSVIDPIRNVAIWRWSVTTSAFGDHNNDADPDGNGTTWWFQLRYPGQYDDGSWVPTYNHFRHYEAGTGRYVESDPIGLAGGISTYGYAGSNPIRFWDSAGLNWTWSGTVKSLTAGEGLGGGHFLFDLTSDCWKGKRWHVLVSAKAAGLTATLPKWVVPADWTSQNINFKDNIPNSWLRGDEGKALFEEIPNLLFGNSAFSYGGASDVIGNQGGSLDSFQFDYGYHSMVSTDTWGDVGIDFGTSLLGGSSKLLESSKERCSCSHQ
jgi:RHS repeat-associated protein